jgi:thioredoxin-dependent peroxiredoxin
MVMAKETFDFSLLDKDGNVYSFQNVSTPWLVVFFYPKDSTPGCTIEANEFSRMLPEFAKANATVYGISGGDAKSKEKFCKNNVLSVTLLSDTDFAVAKMFGAYGKKKFMGREYDGIFRNTYVFKNKELVKLFESVTPLGHAKEVLDFITSQS